MARSTEQSYRSIVEYLQSKRLPATINDMINANVSSRATLYKLLRPEMFPNAAMFGIKVLNDSKPYFFVYDAEYQLDIIKQADPVTGSAIKDNNDVLMRAAEIVAKAETSLDVIDSQVHTAVTKFREKYDKDEVLSENFKQPVNTPRGYLTFMVEHIDTLEAEPLKFMNVLLSAFVALSKEL